MQQNVELSRGVLSASDQLHSTSKIKLIIEVKAISLPKLPKLQTPFLAIYYSWQISILGTGVNYPWNGWSIKTSLEHIKKEL